MKNGKAKNEKISLAGQKLYPHLKLTAEKFPRLLVTRKIENDGAEYFGAFLPETGVRFFLDFINKVFRLRTCTIEIDGQFNVPCPQFYVKRCLAPCVENLCTEKEYLEMTGLLQLFLRRELPELKGKILEKIESFSAALDFETASVWHDRLAAVENFRQKNEWGLWLDETKDFWEIERRDDKILIYLVTMSGRKTLGKRAFVWANNNFTDAEILNRILPEFYRFHAPAEIRVFDDFSNRKIFARELSTRENRQVKIFVSSEKNRKITAERALRRNRHESKLQSIKPPASILELQAELRSIFHLPVLPRRIEAFDAAHISGTNSVAACVVWQDGKFMAEDYRFWLLNKTSETEAIKTAVAGRFQNRNQKVDLVVIDGGTAQLNAALKALENFPERRFFVISAVKPPGAHGAISHFLTGTSDKILFEENSNAFAFLQNLRDEAHNFANSTHRTRRDFSHFYEPAAVLPSFDEKARRLIIKKIGSLGRLKETSLENLLENFDTFTAQKIFQDVSKYKSGGKPRLEPLIVPVRFDDPNGDAQGLQPLQAFPKAKF